MEWHTPVRLQTATRTYESTYGLWRNSEIVRSMEHLDEVIPLLDVVADREMDRILEYLAGDAQEPIVAISRPLVRGPLADSGIPAWAEAYIAAVPKDEFEALMSAAMYLGIHMLFMLGAAYRAWTLKMGVQPLPEVPVMDAEQEAAWKAEHSYAWDHVVTTPFANPFLERS